MLNKMLNGKKGLTLVELLAVLVILGIVAAIAVPTIGSTIQNSRKKADIGTLHLIEDAATRYSLEQQMTAGNDGSVGRVNGNIATELVNKGYLLKDPGTLQSDPARTFDSFEVTIDPASNKMTITIYDGGSTPAPITEANINIP